MEVTREHIEGESSTTSTAEADDSWKEEYAAYLAEKERELEEEKADTPDSSATSSAQKETDKTAESTWEEQYAAYCIEKEARLAGPFWPLPRLLSGRATPASASKAAVFFSSLLLKFSFKSFLTEMIAQQHLAAKVL